MKPKALWLLIVIFLIGFFLMPQPLFCEVIILKSGKKIEVKIVERTDTYIKADPGVGTILTFFLDEIDKIEETPAQVEIDPYHKKERISRDAKDTARSIFEKGLKSATKNNFSNAKKNFTKALKIDKFQFSAIMGLKFMADVEKGIIDEEYALFLFRGWNYSLSNKFEEASAELSKAEETNPDYPELRFLLGRNYLRSGDCTKAIKYLKEYLKDNPQGGMAYSLLGYAYFARHRKDAIRNYKKARDLFLQDNDYYNVERVDSEMRNIPDF